MSGKLTRVTLSPKHLDDYSVFVKETVTKITQLAQSLHGLKISHLSATSQGGGVSEILHSMIPLQNDIGLESSWYTLPQNNDFFTITKKIHNFMQGKKGDLTDEEKALYLSYTKDISDEVLAIEADILIVHDPQPLPVITHLRENDHTFKKILWRCHMDTSAPNQNVWNFLLPFIKEYDNLIFSMREFTNDSFSEEKVSIITPGIDPLTEKNKPMPIEKARDFVKAAGVDIDSPLLVQVSRFDPWKDPLGVIDAYRGAKEKFPKLQLVFLGQIASDDPEGEEVLTQMRDKIGGEDGIFIFTDFGVEGVNAFQTVAFAVLQKSLKEGFGLTVTEAMWKGKVVIGGNVSGIALQIQDGVNGYLVSSVEETTEKIVQLLTDPEKVDDISEQARKTVIDKYLTPHKLYDYLTLFASFHLHIS